MCGPPLQVLHWTMEKKKIFFFLGGGTPPLSLSGGKAGSLFFFFVSSSFCLFLKELKFSPNHPPPRGLCFFFGLAGIRETIWSVGGFFFWSRVGDRGWWGKGGRLALRTFLSQQVLHSCTDRFHYIFWECLFKFAHLLL